MQKLVADKQANPHACACPVFHAVCSFGGGKIIDVGKLVAHKLGSKSIVVPSVASTDAPCTALSVLYTEEGAFEEYIFFNKVRGSTKQGGEGAFSCVVRAGLWRYGTPISVLCNALKRLNQLIGGVGFRV